MVDLLYQYEASIRLSLFLGGFILFSSWEWFRPKRKLSQHKLKRWLNNLALIACGTILVRILVPTAAIGVAYFAEQHQWGIANHFSWPFWLKVFITFILLDLTVYFQHAIFHVLPVMWRLHRVHHSDLDCDITTGLRFHPLEILISMLIKLMAITALGAPVLAVILFEVVLNLMSMFTHSNIQLNKNFEHILRWLIVTPDMHRVHHSARENETNSNFSFHLSIWDRIFGTYIAEPAAGQLGMKIGLEHFRKPNWQSLKGLIYMPFVTGIRGYAINYRDTKNADELSLAREKAQLASELASYMQAINQHALVSVTDAKGKIIKVNKKFCEVSGYSEQELIGQDHRILNSGTHPSSFFKNMWQTIKKGKSWRNEVCNRAKNGHLYWVDNTIIPNRDIDKKINSFVSVRIDITERKNHEEKLEKAYKELAQINHHLETISRIDALTNISNRRDFDETLLSEISKLSRINASITLILCDIDFFKKYNDRYGHPAGDACLQEVAQAIKASFSRAGDLVARYGGEEFAVVVSAVDKETALVLAERMRKNVAGLKLPHNTSEIDSVVTISVGVVTLAIDKNTTPATVIEKADKALYMAKENGRNNVQSFD